MNDFDVNSDNNNLDYLKQRSYLMEEPPPSLNDDELLEVIF